MRGQSSPDTRVVGNHLIVLINQIFVPDSFQEVPDRLDIVVVERVIRLVDVNPEAHPFSHLFPITDVTHHGFSAASVELGNANLCFDFRFIKDAQFLFYLMLNGQSVGIPTSFSWRIETAHCFVTGIDVLERAGQHMVNTRLTVCGRWAFVKSEERAPFRLTQCLGKNVLVTPEIKDALL